MRAPASLLENQLERFSQRAGRIRQDLYYCDVSAPNHATRELRVGVRAAAYVYTAAALEALVKDCVTGLLQQLNTKTLSAGQLRLSLLSLIRSPDFDALRDASGMRMWVRRAATLESCQDQHQELFNLAILPLDGRTIRSGHFESLWSIFGFEGDPLPSARHKLALKDLADARNDLAHGDVDSREIAGRKDVTSLLRLVAQIEDCALHLVAAIDSYLAKDLYLR
ncbi:MAE_28990/MAE_18760 family HEPN-like nuclease [Aquipuribacter hungaricus]|uniref:MAE_28990/MAE_18760 family HEPN-like nuclease n=1 Tax=Aquipuribacter hungaricus TaxID=545624 RepID=UPI003BEEB858